MKKECVTRRYSALPPYLNNNYLKLKQDAKDED